MGDMLIGAEVKIVATTDQATDIASIQSISSVPTILEAVAALTGLRFVCLSPKGSSVLARMRRSAQRMAGLVNDVVDFTRGRMGGGIAVDLRHETAFQAPLMQVIEELRGHYPQRPIEVDFKLDIPVYCDVKRIQQLLSNLLKNALVYGDAARPVLVRCGSQNGIFELSIVNHGPDITQATIDQLFKPFWRATSHASSEGLGLGLFIVSEIARSHGGDLDVDSSDQTTRFTFRLKGEHFVERRRAARG